MNLHEESLLKYLSNPLGLLHSTEMLKINNLLIEKNIIETSKNKLNIHLNRI